MRRPDFDTRLMIKCVRENVKAANKEKGKYLANPNLPLKLRYSFLKIIIEQPHKIRNNDQ